MLKKFRAKELIDTSYRIKLRKNQFFKGIMITCTRKYLEQFYQHLYEINLTPEKLE